MRKDSESGLYVIKAELGVPFGLPKPGAEQFKIEDKGINQYFSKSYELQVKGFGVGSIEAVRDSRYFTDPKFIAKRALPAGSVVIPMEFEDGGSSGIEDPETLPLNFPVVLEGLNDQRLTGLEVRVFSSFSRQGYQGNGLVGIDEEDFDYGAAKPLKDAALGPGELATVSFKEWTDERTGQSKVPFWSVDQILEGDGPRFVISYEAMVGDAMERRSLSTGDVQDLELSNRFLSIFPTIHPDNR